MTANLENVGLYLTRSSPALSERLYDTSVTESSMLCIVESDASHSISCHTLFQTWQPYLPENCLKFAGGSILSLDSEIVLPPARALTDYISSRGSAGSQQLFSVSKTAQDLINDYLEQETNPSRPATVYPKRKIKVNQKSQSDIDVTPSLYKSSIHTLDQSIDSTSSGNIIESKAVDSVIISPTDNFRAEACTSQNDASKNRGHVKVKGAARSAKSISHHNQCRSYTRRCHAHTWASNSKSQPFLDQPVSTVCSSLDVTAAAKSLGEALAAKLQSLLYSGTSNRKCSCECGCQSSVTRTSSRHSGVREESGTKCLGPLCGNKLKIDKQNEKNNCSGSLCYKSLSQKSYFGQDMTTTVNKNISNTQDHPLCKPPCVGSLCRERSKCNEQLNKKTPTEVNTSEAPGPAETKTLPLVPPLLKGHCTDSENCRVKTPESQTRLASSTTIVLKAPCLGPGKCINESLDSQTKCPGGCQARISRNVSDNKQCGRVQSKQHHSESKTRVEAPIWKDSCPGFEKCKPKTPPLTRCPGGCKVKDPEPVLPKPAAQSPIWKDSCPESEKCKNKTPPLTSCPGGCIVKDREPDLPKPAAQSLVRKGSCPGFEKRKSKTPSLTRCPGGCKNKNYELSEQSPICKDSCPGFEKCTHKVPPVTSCPSCDKVKDSEPDTPKPVAQSRGWKGSSPGFEKRKSKTPSLTRCPNFCKDKNFELSEQSRIGKDSYPECEKCKHKAPPLTRCPGGCKVKDSEPNLPKPAAQSPIWKDSYPECEKCKHIAPPLTKCPGGCKVKDSEPNLPKPAAQLTIRKDSYPECEKCKHKAPPLTRCPGGCKAKNSELGLPEPVAHCRSCRSGGYEIPTPRQARTPKINETCQATSQPQATCRKVSSSKPCSSNLSSNIEVPCPGVRKCKDKTSDLPNDKLAKYSVAHEGRHRDPAFKTFEQQCPSISPSVVSLTSRLPPSEVPAPSSGRLKRLKLEIQMRNVGTGSYLPSPALSFSSTGSWGREKSRQKQNTSKNLRNISVGPDRPLSDTKKSQCCGPCYYFSGSAKLTQGTNTGPEIINVSLACGDDYMPKETRCLAACATAARPANDVISGIKSGKVRESRFDVSSSAHIEFKNNATKSVDTVNCCPCVTHAKSLEQRHTNTEPSKSSTAAGPGPCCGDLGFTIIQQRGTNTGPEFGSGEIHGTNSCYVIFKRTKTGLLRPCCTHEGLRKSKEKKCSCTGKSSDNVSNRPAIKISRSVTHKTSTAIKKSILRSCCSCTREVQAKAKISSRSIGIGSDFCLGRPTRCAATNTPQCVIVPDPVKPRSCTTVATQTNTSQCVIVPDPVKPKSCKTVETQMITPQCVVVPDRVKRKCRKTAETQMTKKHNIPCKEAAKRKKTTYIQTLNKFCAKYFRCFGYRPKTCPGKIPPENESNCDKPLCPSKQDLATSDKCAYDRIFSDQSQEIRSQQEVLNLQDPTTQPKCEKKSRRETSCCSKLDRQTQPTSQAQSINSRMPDSTQTIRNQEEVLNPQETLTQLTCEKKSGCEKPCCKLYRETQPRSQAQSIDTRMSDSTQAIRNQEEVLNQQEPPTQPTCEKKSRCDKPCCKLYRETQPRNQAQSIATQNSDSTQLCPKKIGLNKKELPSNSTTNKTSQTNRSQTTSIESCKNPCCPFKGSQISENQTSIESCGNPDFAFEDSQTSGNQTTSIDSCVSPNFPFRDSQTDRDQTTSIESCTNPDCPFKDSQMDEQTTSLESCDNPCCPNRESEANRKTSSRRRWASPSPYQDTPGNNNQPATLFCNRQPTVSCRFPSCCRVKGPQMQSSATSRRMLQTTKNNVQQYNNEKTHWAKSCCGNTFRSKRETIQANSFHNCKANTQCACCSRHMILTSMHRSPTNCRSVCCFEVLQTNEHPPCVNSYPSADSQSYQSNNDERDEEKSSKNKCCEYTQETQTQSVEMHYKPVPPYSSKLSSRKGLCLKFRPVAQKTLKYFARAAQEHPSRPQKVKDHSSNPQEVGDYPPRPQEIGDYPTSPQESQRYLVSQQCDSSSPQSYSTSAQDSVSRPQGRQGYLSTPRCDPECSESYLTTPGCDLECPKGYSECAQDGASRPQGTQSYLSTQACNPECPQGYSGCDQGGASHLQGVQGNPTTPRCEPDCLQRCQRPVCPPYLERDSNRPALLSISFTQTEFPYEEIKPEKRAKQKKKSRNATKSKEIVQGTDYPCAQVYQDDPVPCGSALSLNSSEGSSLKSENSATCVNSKKVKSQKALKSKKQSRVVEIPCVNISQQQITPCGSNSSLAMSRRASTDGSKKSSKSVKQPKVKPPKATKSKKQSWQAEIPCDNISQQKITPCGSYSSLAMSKTASTDGSKKSAKSVKQPKVKPPKATKSKKQSWQAEIPCVNKSQQKITPCGSYSSLAMSKTASTDGSKKSAKSGKQPKVKPTKAKKQSKQVQIPCVNISQQNITSCGSYSSLAMSKKASTDGSKKSAKSVKQPKVKPTKAKKQSKQVQIPCVNISQQNITSCGSYSSLAMSKKASTDGSKKSAKSVKQPKVKPTKAKKQSKQAEIPCVNMSQQKITICGSYSSLAMSKRASTDGSKKTSKSVKEPKVKPTKAKKKSKQVEIPCVNISQIELPPCGSLSSLAMSRMSSTNGSKKIGKSVKQPKVKPPKTPKASKAPKKSKQATAVESPCSVCQEELLSSDSLCSLTISATSVKSSRAKSPKPAKVKTSKQEKCSKPLKPTKLVESICPICQQKLREYDSLTSLAVSATSVKSSKVKSPKPAKVKSPKVSKPAKSVEFPCGICQQKLLSSVSSSSLAKSATSVKSTKPAKVSKPSKANSVEFPCGICQQKLTSSESSTTSSSGVSATSVKSSKVKPTKPAKVKSPNPAKVSKPPKSVDFPCGICQQKFMSSESSINSAMSATSVKSSKPKPAKVHKPQQVSAEFPCGHICQQKLTPAGSPAISQSVSPSRSKVKTKSKAASIQPPPSDFPCGHVCQQKILPPMISREESPKPICRTTVKLKDPGSYKGDQEGVISVAQYEKNKRKKKKTKQLSTDVCLPICGKDDKKKKERFQVVDCVKGSRSVKATIITCQCPKPEPSKKRGALACVLETICKSLKPVPPTPQVTVLPPTGPSKCLQNVLLTCKCPAPDSACTAVAESPRPTGAETGSEQASCKRSPELCEAPANRGFKVQVQRKGPAGLAAWCPLLNKC
ncbi:uncharacterized protein LOC133526023 [Cydia pomonella]|uniref:uncharacterized protein LOC133526023 n=1 Tax=Cydia pomonella TaxID=82600 RepID=UPI002ADE0DBF|nr:uncharacterized protein LOC133526023 [Cydia pomonella]